MAQPKKTPEPAKRAGFSAVERAAMKERAEEVKAAKSRSGPSGRKADGQDVLAKIAELAPADRGLAERVHHLVITTLPQATPRLWYGMPAYALDGKVLCFFQGATKFKTRYSTLGFSDAARLDDGDLWPTAFALSAMTPATEDAIRSLLTKAASS